MSTHKLYTAIVVLLVSYASAATQSHATCRLVLLGHASSNSSSSGRSVSSNTFPTPGVSKASLVCSSSTNTPITVIVNSTYIGAAAAANFSGVTVLQDASCQGDDDRLVHHLLQFCGSYHVQLVQPVVSGVWLQGASSTAETWSSAVLSFGASVSASIVSGSFVGNAAAYVLLARADAHVSVTASRFNGSEGTAAAAMGASKLLVSSSVFESNHARERGGALLATASATVSIHDSSCENNSVPLKVDMNNNGFGGVLVLEQAATATISNSRFASNVGGFGGVIYMEAKSLTVSNCSFTRKSGFHRGVAHVKGQSQVSEGII